MRRVSKNWSVAPDVKFARANFNLSHGVQTSLNPGVLVPLEFDEVLPGDTFNDASTHLVRVSSSFAKPFVGDVYLDTYKFFVPLRLLMADLENVFGQSGLTQWTRLEMDQTPIPTTEEASTVTKGSVADYLGLPVGAALPTGISVLPFRAFALIWNEWFRNQNVHDDVNVSDASTRASFEKVNSNAWSTTNYFGMLPPVNRYKDYFTSALLAPQKGVEFYLDGSQVDPKFVQFVSTGLDLDQYRGSPIWQSEVTGDLITGGLPLSAGNGSTGNKTYYDDAASSPGIPEEAGIANATYHIPSVNEARLAFQMQKYLEADALGGSRYREYILSHYGVDNGDARMQIPEFLAGAHNRINVQQVTTTAQTEISGETYPVGSLAGYSHTIGNRKAHYVKSFTEHGYVFTVVCVRQKHTYSQGIHKKWFRHVRTEFYDPKFAFLGFQPIYFHEIYGFGSGALKSSGVFGYQEPYGEYRCGVNVATAGMRPTGSGALGDVWGIGDLFAAKPSLANLSDETSANLSRVVTVDPSTEDMFIVDTWFDRSAVRVIPAYATPGLVDHH